MPSQYIRALGVVVGLAAVLSMASISADQPSDEQASRQIERQLSKNEAFRDVTISVQEHVASLHGCARAQHPAQQDTWLSDTGGYTRGNRCTDRLNSHAKGGVTDQMEVVAVLYTGVDAE